MNDSNPVWMFLSFVSPKQFFSVITRKIVENYKVNLFDISLDSLDVDIWLWTSKDLTPKELQSYYSYNVVSNINWWKMYSPSNIWVAISLVSSLYVSKIFSSYHWSYFYNFLVTIYILVFVFSWSLKQFPYTDDKKNYRRFLDVFFSFYKLTLERAHKEETLDKNVYESLKKDLLQEVHLFFMLYRVYFRLQRVLINSWIWDKDFYKRMFSEHWNQTDDEMIQDFISHSSSYTKMKQFTQYDERLIKLLLPHDILIKYIFHHSQMQLTVDHLVAWIFDRPTLDMYISSFHLWTDSLEPFLMYICDHSIYKKNYFTSMKKFILHACRLWADYQKSQEVKQFLDSIDSGNISNVDMSSIPESLKKESSLTERSINFYLTFLWWTRVWRGDGYVWRLFHKELLNEIIEPHFSDSLSHESLVFYWWLLYLYSKNVFYYQHAYENVRKGKEVFSMPGKPSSKEIYSNVFILKMLDENALITVFQDVNKKDFSLQITDEEYINEFKRVIWPNLETLPLTSSRKDLFSAVYADVLTLCPLLWETILWYDSLMNQLYIWENVYTVDLWIWKAVLSSLANAHVHQESIQPYSELVLIHIMAILRETLFWYLLMITFIKQKEREDGVYYGHSLLSRLYINDVLLIPIDKREDFHGYLDEVLLSFDTLLEKRLPLDENISYVTIWFNNRVWFIDSSSSEAVLESVTWEDIVRMRWYLKNITYYNKRYIRPF